MSSRATKNNVLTGVFVVGSLALALALIVIFSNAFDKYLVARTAYVFRFNIRDGAAGIKRDSMVKVGGQSAGLVTAVSFRPPAGTNDPTGTIRLPAADAASIAPTHVYVTVKIRSEIELYAGASVYLELPLLGSVSTINIPDIGYRPRASTTQDGKTIPGGPAIRLQAFDLIEGNLAPPSFLAQAGYGPDQAEQLRKIFQRGTEIGDQVQALVGQVQTSLPPAFSSAQDALDNVKEITSQVKKGVPGWLTLITQSLENAQAATGNADELMVTARLMVQGLRETFDKNRPFIDAVFFNTAQLTEKINDEMYATLLGIMTDGRRATADLADTLARVRLMVAEETPNFRRTMADARLSADQMKLAMMEIRRNPWRLLYQPTRKELAEELTYDSARTYANAVSDLRSASESLQSLIAAVDTGTTKSPLDRNRIDEITKEVNESFGRYKEAERELLDRLVRESK